MAQFSMRHAMCPCDDAIESTTFLSNFCCDAMEAAGGVVRTPRHHERLHLAHQRVLDRVRDLGHDVRLRFGRPALRCRQIKSNLPHGEENTI